MIKRVDRMQTVKNVLRKQCQPIIFNQEQDIVSMYEMNERLKEFRNDSKTKERNSYVSAFYVIITN